MNIFNPLIVATIIINLIVWGLVYKLLSSVRIGGKK